MKITTIQPHVFDNYLILGLEKKWSKHLKENSIFTVKILKDKLILECDIIE